MKLALQYNMPHDSHDNLILHPQVRSITSDKPCVSAHNAKYPSAGIGYWLNLANTVLYLWYERTKQRKQLARLDEHLLADIGLSRAEADAEARKPFWQA